MPAKSDEPKFQLAPEVEKIASSLISDYHTWLKAYDVRIDYWFLDKAPKKDGKLTLGTMQLIKGEKAFLAGPNKKFPHWTPGDPFYLNKMSLDTWRKLTDRARLVLTDHELCHCHFEGVGAYDKPNLGLAPHDVEEFNAIVERYGPWKFDLALFLKAAGPQMELPFESEWRDGEDDDEEATSLRMDFGKESLTISTPADGNKVTIAGANALQALEARLTAQGVPHARPH